MLSRKFSIKLLALAVVAVSSNAVLADDEDKPYNQFESKGFAEDADLTLNLRNWYHEQRGKRTGGREAYEWTQGFNLRFESGFTQGDFGLGLDAFVIEGVKLERKGDALGAVGYKGGGKARDYWGRLGIAGKAAYSQTILKYGYQSDIDLPVLSLDDGRTIPESARGALFTTHDFENLELNVGWFDNGAGMNDIKHDSMNKIMLLGGTYTLDDNLSASLYFSDVKDTFKKRYGNLNYSFDFSSVDKMEVDFNVYHTSYKGTDDKNLIFSIAPSYNTGAHTVMLAYQHNSGDAGYDFGVDGGGTIYLANSNYTDYNNAKERSYHVKYGLDFETLGVNGLEAAIGHIYGENIEGDKDAKERETYLEASYTLPNGILKGLSFRVQHFGYRATGEDKVYDNRFKIEYPLVLL